jgi:predicted nucleic acid-binding protein
MMVFFDTNILIYAFCKNLNNKEQQDIALKLFAEAIENQNLMVSELILCEFAFISNKLKEDKNNIDNNLKFLSIFLKQSNPNINLRMTEVLKETSLYNSSFDVYHLVFAEYYNSKLFTFDKGFKKL